jgi:hypothetical protein
MGLFCVPGSDDGAAGEVRHDRADARATGQGHQSPSPRPWITESPLKVAVRPSLLITTADWGLARSAPQPLLCPAQFVQNVPSR